MMNIVINFLPPNWGFVFVYEECSYEKYDDVMEKYVSVSIVCV